MNTFISVGIDVAADFSFFAIVLPGGQLFRKPFKVIHTDLTSIDNAVQTIKKAEEQFSMKSQIFLESTGIFHLPLFCFLNEAGFDVFIINPIITHSNKSISIRKVKNDKFDAIQIAILGFNQDIKKSIMPEPFVLNLRCLCREYFSLSDNRTALVNKLSNHLRIAFPAIFGVFSSISSKACLAFLSEINSLDDFLSRKDDDMIQLIANASRRSLAASKSKYDALVEAAKISKQLSQALPHIFTVVHSVVCLIQQIDDQMNAIMDAISSIIKEHAHEPFLQQIRLIDSIPGIGLFSAVALMCEIGDFSCFRNPKQLFAYFGMDPSVNESGKFKGTKNHMSKRGSKFARRVLFAAALASVRTNKNGTDVNPVLKAYYAKKIESKPKKVALGAIMHKVCNLVFAVLRAHSPFALRTPEVHIALFFSA